ncbi:MAG: hypothetical protein AAF431_00950 [Pseudomonadota bacterium]
MQNKQDYEAQLNSNFVIELDEGELNLELVEVSSVVAEKTETGQAEPFSALFRSDRQEGLEQGVYTLKHAEQGDITLFVVPIGPDDVGMRYEAIFT